MMKKWLAILFGWMCFSVQAKSILLDKNLLVVDGVDYIQYYLSTDSIQHPEEQYFQIKNAPNQKLKKHLFFTTQSQKWILFDVHNPQAEAFDLLVEMGNLGIHRADYYVFQDDEITYQNSISTQSGLATSKYYDRNIVIPYTVEPQNHLSFLIRVHTNAPIIDLPIILWNKKNKYEISQGIELGRGLFYGVLSFYIVMTGLIFFLIRGKSNIFFWTYISLGGFLLFLRSGIPLEVMWSGRIYLDFILKNIVLYTYLLVTLRFLKYYLTNKMQSSWQINILDAVFVLGCLLLLLYLPFTYLNVFLQDTLLIVQMIYINLTNILVILLMFWALPKVEDKFVLVSSLIYYFLFSTYLFNPFIEFGFWTGKLIGHILLYSGGGILGVILLTISTYRMRVVIRKNQEIKHELRNLHKIYSQSLVQGQEQQRRKVAEELHDGIGAHLSAIKMKLSTVKMQLTDSSEIQLLDRVLENLDEGTHQVREMSHELMPPTLNRYGLQVSLADLFKKYQATYPIKLHFKSNLNRNKLDSNSELIIYRLLQQLLETMVHGLSNKADIKLVILPTIEMATIQVKYSGGDPVHQKDSREVQDLRALVNILQGKMEFFMSNIWDDELNIEIPIQLHETHQIVE